MRERGEELVLRAVGALRLLLGGAGLDQEGRALRLGLLALGDVLDREEDHGHAGVRLDRVRREGEPPLPGGEVQLDLMATEPGPRGEEQALEHGPDLRDVQRPALPFERRLPFGALRRHREPGIKRLVRGEHAQALVEDHERDLHRFDDPGGVVARPLRIAYVVLEHVDVDERDHRAVDPVVGRPVGTDLHPVEAALAVLHLGLLQRARGDRFRDPLVEIRDVNVRLDVVDRPAQVRREDVHQAAGLGREAADAPLDIEDHHRQIDGVEEVDEIGVDLLQFLVAAVQLVVDGDQLLVR